MKYSVEKHFTGDIQLNHERAFNMFNDSFTLYSMVKIQGGSQPSPAYTTKLYRDLDKLHKVQTRFRSPKASRHSVPSGEKLLIQ